MAEARDPGERGPESLLERLAREVGPGVDPEVALDAPRDGTSGVLARMESRPRVSGRYRVEGEIARGGMGAILEVWDEDLRRHLAMKVALGKGESGSATAASELDPRLLSRFLEEAQVTGQLEHPGIVPVHELGVDENGVVFFTMQRVRGRDLDEVFGLVGDGLEGWSVTRAVGVLRQVCEAMAFAHDKGVVHRDLKPANVMVGSFGEVYVMDWGLVRIQGQEDRHDVRPRDAARQDSGPAVETDPRQDFRGLESDALRTMDGDVLGTPAYMSPEQARGDLARIDGRSDVYAVGAMLYRLLAGVAPYGRRGEHVAAIDVLGALRAGPPTPLVELSPEAPPELVAIAEKAMSREPGDRYADMMGLAEDLRAYLENRVVRAYRTGAIAEARTWVRRNRALATSVAAGVLALVAGLAATLVLKSRSDANADRASRQASIAREVNGFMNDDLLAAIDPEAEGIDVTVREVLVAAAQRLDGRFPGEPLVEAELRETIGTSFHRLGEFESARVHLERAHELYRAELGEGAEETLTAAASVATVWANVGRFDESLRLLDQLVERRRALGATDDDPSLFEIRAARTGALRQSGRLPDAIRETEALVADLTRAYGPNDVRSLRARSDLSLVMVESGRIDEARAIQEEVVRALRDELGAGHPDAISALSNLAMTRLEEGAFTEAAELHRELYELRRSVLGPDHPSTFLSLVSLGAARFEEGRLEEAEEVLTEAWEGLRRTLGSDHRLTLQAAGNLVGVINAAGLSEKALELREEVLAAQRRTLGPDHPLTLVSLRNLGTILTDLGRLDDSEQLHLELLELEANSLGATHPDVFSTKENLARVHYRRGEYERSRELLGEVIEGRKAALGEDHPDVARSIFNLGMVVKSTQGAAEAVPIFEVALAASRAAHPGPHPDICLSLKELAMILQDEDLETAMEYYREAADIWLALGSDNADIGYLLHQAAWCAWKLGDFVTAADTGLEALDWRREHLGIGHEDTRTTLVATMRYLELAELWEEAIELAVELHEWRVAEYGEDDGKVWSLRARIVALYEGWGRPDEAARWR